MEGDVGNSFAAFGFGRIFLENIPASNEVVSYWPSLAHQRGSGRIEIRLEIQTGRRVKMVMRRLASQFCLHSLPSK